MATQKIVNLLNIPENEYSKFATKKWYIVGSESKGVYWNNNPIKFLTKPIESRFCDYSDVLITGNIAVARTVAAAGNDPLKQKETLIAARQVAFKNLKCTI